MPPERKLGLIAGSGRLPRLLVDAAKRQNLAIIAVAFSGTTDPTSISDIDHFWSRAGKAGSILRRFKAEGVTDIVMAGAMRRPSLAELRPDWYTARFYARLGRAALGDDKYLRALAKTIEGEGFSVCGISEFVPEVLAPVGPVGSLVPDAQSEADVKFGINVLHELGQLDIGQAAVIQQGIVLGVEAAEGTDALIMRCGTLARKGAKPVLVKRSKPVQDLRIDMPTIGQRTLELLRKSGFGGVAVEAERTILLDTDELAQCADNLGLFLVGVATNA